MFIRYRRHLFLIQYIFKHYSHFFNLQIHRLIIQPSLCMLLYIFLMRFRNKWTDARLSCKNLPSNEYTSFCTIVYYNWKLSTLKKFFQSYSYRPTATSRSPYENLAMYFKFFFKQNCTYIHTCTNFKFGYSSMDIVHLTTTQAKMNEFPL